MINDIQQDADNRMKQSIEHLKTELSKVRTGRAHVSLLDHLKVDFYGSKVPVSQAASVSVGDSRSLVIQPWDKEMVGVIEKAIMESDLGLNPNTAGTTIRIVLPALTEERRKELTKVVHAEGESAKVAIRNTRRDANKSAMELQKDKQITEDDQRRAEGDIQQLTDKYCNDVDAIIEAKDKELLEI